MITDVDWITMKTLLPLSPYFKVTDSHGDYQIWVSIAGNTVRAVLSDSVDMAEYDSLFSAGAEQFSRHFDPVPPSGYLNRTRFFSGLLGTSGLDSTTSQNIDGSVTPVDFYISADANADIHITKLVFSLTDKSISHYKWGKLSTLTTGYDIIVTESGVDNFVVNKAKSVYDMIEQTLVNSPFGEESESFTISDSVKSGGSKKDSTVLPFDFSTVLPGGIRIGRGTSDRITARVNDDLSAIFDQKVRVIGYRLYPGGDVA